MKFNKAVFTGGEIAPTLYARTDIDGYVTGAKELENSIVHAHGGASGRSGFQFIGEVKDSSNPVRLIPFIYNTEDTYVLEFSDYAMRVWRDGGKVLNSTTFTIGTMYNGSADLVYIDTNTSHGLTTGDEIYLSGIASTEGDEMLELNGRFYNVTVIDSNTVSLPAAISWAYYGETYTADSGTLSVVYEIATPYPIADVPGLYYNQSNNLMILTHKDYPPRELSRTDHDEWTMAAIAFNNVAAAPTGLVTSTTGFDNRDMAVYYRVSYVNAAGQESEASEPVRAYVDTAWEDREKVVLTWSAVTSITAAVTGGTRADPCVITAAGHGFSTGDSVQLSDIIGLYDYDGATDTRTDLNGDVFEITVVNVNSFSLNGVDSSAWSNAYSSGGVASLVLAEKTITGITKGVNAQLTVTGHGFSADDRVYIDNVSGMTEINGVEATIVSVVDTNNFTVNINSTGYSTYSSGGTVTLQSGAKYYKVYKNDYGLYGLVAEREETNWTDKNTAPDVASGVLEVTSQFDSGNNYPTITTFYQQRLMAASTTLNPITIWASITGDFYNFNAHFPSLADDGFELTMDVDQVNSVRHLVSMRDLLVLTSGGVHTMSSGDNAFTPDNTKIVPQSYYGASELKPIQIGETALYVQHRGRKVRDLVYSFDIDGFAGSDRTILADHLFEDYSIVDWAYAESPDGIIWCVRSDGVLCGLTYLREHKVNAWHRHTTDGEFENVCVIPETEDDGVYVVVKRTIGGETKRYVEHMAGNRNWSSVADAFFVDSGLSYDGAPVTRISGLDHLEGKTVVALADGNVLRDLVVSGGEVELGAAYSKVHVGLPYTSIIHTLDPPIETRSGTTIGKRKSVSRVRVGVYRSRSFELGPDAEHLTQINWRDTEVWGDADALYSGYVELSIDPNWLNRGALYMRQVDPVPFTITSFIPDVQIGA
jgi:hypothetical protein